MRLPGEVAGKAASERGRIRCKRPLCAPDVKCTRQHAGGKEAEYPRAEGAVTAKGFADPLREKSQWTRGKS